MRKCVFFNIKLKKKIFKMWECIKIILLWLLFIKRGKLYKNILLLNWLKGIY